MPHNPALFDSPDHLALVRAVCEDPQDDLPRLVYADWMEENGFAKRAEFVRESIRLERGDWACPLMFMSCPESLNYEFKKIALSGCQKCQEWAKLCLKINTMQAGFTTAAGTVRLTYSRGFADGVVMESRRFLGDAADLFVCQPILRVRLTDLSPYSAAIDRKRWFRRDDQIPEHASAKCLLPDQLTAEGWEFPAVFPTVGEAQDALSRACVRHGRRVAGLRSLKAEEMK